MSKKKIFNSIGGGRNHRDSRNSPEVRVAVSDKQYVKNFILMLHQYDDVAILPRKNLGEYLRDKTNDINLYSVNIDDLSDDQISGLATILNHKFLEENIWTNLNLDEPNYWQQGKKRYLRIYKQQEAGIYPSQHESLKISSYRRRQPQGYLTSGYPGGRAINTPSESNDDFSSFLATINRELFEELGFTIEVANLVFPPGMNLQSQINLGTPGINDGNTGKFLDRGIKLGSAVTLTVRANPPPVGAAAAAPQITLNNCSVTISYSSGKYYLNIGLLSHDYQSLRQFIEQNFSPVGRTETMDVMMEKYLKYKNKYLQLKKKLENQKN
jgi:hypothetical protein